MEVVFEAEPMPVTPQELSEWEASEAVRRFREMGGELELGRIPEAKPYFDGLYRDREGFLWISVPGGAYQVRFAILDPDGRFMGEVAAEGMNRATWVDPVVRNGRLHLVGRDELDVERVYVFEIRK